VTYHARQIAPFKWVQVNEIIFKARGDGDREFLGTKLGDTKCEELITNLRRREHTQVL